MLYLDSSALVKLVIDERGSAELQAYLREQEIELASATLAAIEVPRALERRGAGPEVLEMADLVLERVDLHRLDEGVIAAARQIPPHVRSLDAVHLATAITARAAIAGFVAYDRRLLDAAREHGFAVAAPGFE